MDNSDYQYNVTPDTIQFVKERVLSVTDLTRTTKLTEILESYSNKKSQDIYIVQNTRNRDAHAVLANVDYFQELLQYKAAVEQAMDQLIEEAAISRKNELAQIPISEVIENLNLDVTGIIKLSESISEEE